MASYEEMMRRARGVVPGLREAIVSDMEKIIARGDELHEKREKATQAHIQALDQDHDALDGFEHELDEFSNSARHLNGGDNGEKVVVSTADIGSLKVDGAEVKVEEEKTGEEVVGAQVPANSFPQSGT